MKCPACGNNLTEKEFKEINVDVCENGCGGIWFDLFELKKVDEPHETAEEELLHVKRDPAIKPDPSAQRMCPRCYGTMMVQHFFSVKRKVELNECPKCGGFWLDPGELAMIRSLYPSEKARHEEAKHLFDDLVAEKFQILTSQSRESMEKRKKLAKMFRFICPSYYLPGDQAWGAF